MIVGINFPKPSTWSWCYPCSDQEMPSGQRWLRLHGPSWKRCCNLAPAPGNPAVGTYREGCECQHSEGGAQPTKTAWHFPSRSPAVPGLRPQGRWAFPAFHNKCWVQDALGQSFPDILFYDGSSLVLLMERFCLVFEKENSGSENSLNTSESWSELQPPADPTWSQPEGEIASGFY